MAFRDGEIGIILRDYVCAQCYADLRKDFADDRRWTANCPTHGDVEKCGRVTKKFAENLGQKLVSRRKEIEYYEPKEIRPEQEIMQELGFTS